MALSCLVTHAVCAALLFFAYASPCWGGGPRFVTGTSYGAAAGQMMAFYTPNVTYFTDPGDLAAGVTHAQADAMVAAAAAPWNVPVALLTLAQGGTLSEHVSDQNTYFNGTSLVLPADAEPSNYLSRPIAIVYDTDGSVTDLLLGEGASSPSACRHNAVTESVDGFGPSGTIQHALILLNGRCVGSNAQQLLQMQYQLERAFGRVLGLAWSQLNDNVFTAAAPVKLDQENYWPVMHPIDVLCSSYTYQCMVNPWQLRADDISALALLYPVTASNVVAGKTASLNANSIQLSTGIFFPDNQSMSQVNLVLREGIFGLTFNDFDTVGGVSGALYQRNGGNPVTGPAPAADRAGSNSEVYESRAYIGWSPLPFFDGRLSQIVLYAESINPLYSGDAAVGTYEGAPVSYGGSNVSQAGLVSSANFLWNPYLWAAGEPTTCAAAADGSASAPSAIPATGFWTNTLCPEGHVSWLTATFKAGRTWTLETTATDENAYATSTKMKPVIGVWMGSDAPGLLPTIAATPSAFNATSLGMTQLSAPAATQSETLRIAIADQLGQGRPDFSYKARLLYADAITPAAVGSGGGTVTITGTGFRAGNQVLVNGIPATPTSWTATQIVATVPPSTTVGSTGAALDITVRDPATNGQTTITGALSYTSAPDTITLTSAPGVLATGLPSTTPFAVQVLASDGTPVTTATVRLTLTGPATLAVCATFPCTLHTDGTGNITTGITGSAAGSITLTATEVSGGATLSVTLTDTDPIRAITTPAAPRYIAAGAAVSWTVIVLPTLNSAPAAGIPITWTATNGLTLSASQSTTDSTGVATITVQSTSLTASGSATIIGCGWSNVCATATAYAVASPQWTPIVTTGAGQSVSVGATLQPLTLLITDGATHPLQGAPVSVYQTVDAWEGICPTHGPCASAPVLKTLTNTATSAADGTITFTPLQVSAGPQVVNIAASTGTQGFIALTLDITP